MPVEDERRNPSGNPSYRYGPRDKPFTPAKGDGDTIADVESWIDRHLPKVGADRWVFHEIVSDLVHLDVHVAGPSDDRPFCTLVTSGMSERPMAVPTHPDLDPVEVAYAELLIHLPPDWPGLDGREMYQSPEAWKDENYYWPVRLLKTLARFPHEHDTWLGYGHTMGNGDPPAPYAPGTDLSAVLLLPSIAMDESSYQLETPSRKINFFALYPLYAEELAFKLERGTEPLLGKLGEADIGPVLDPRRPNACEAIADAPDAPPEPPKRLRRFWPF